MRLQWLARVLRDAGLTVIEHDNPYNRGRDLTTIRGIVAHDTVTGPNVSDLRVANLLRDGHSTLRGPLAQLGLDRQGRYWLIATGRCNHNGYGTWGNDSIGVEVFANGGATPKEPWNAIQREAFAVGAAALLDELDLPAANVLGHKETDPRRKQDPYAVDMDATRSHIRRLIAVQNAPEPEPEEEYVMPNDVVEVNGEVYVILYAVMQRVKVPADQRDHYRRLASSEVNRQFNGPYKWDRSRLAAFRPQTPADE